MERQTSQRRSTTTYSANGKGKTGPSQATISLLIGPLGGGTELDTCDDGRAGEREEWR